jgi:5-methyltetrahydrofolate--homocysteine methyltransferase
VGLKEKLGKEILFFDGAMGTMLQKKGLKLGKMPEDLNIDNPDVIEEIHRLYVDSGADIITTNTFGANKLKLEHSSYSQEEIIKAAVLTAKKANPDGYVALDIGPLGQLLEPLGVLTFEEAYDLFKEQIILGEKYGADAVIIETMVDIYEAKAAILAAKENSSLPVICTVTFQEDKRMLTGTSILGAVTILESLGVDALGVNCSLGPKELIPIVDELLEYSKTPVIVQPNAGLPKMIDGNTVFDLSVDEYSSIMNEFAHKGVSILGGCCGTDEAFIKSIKNKLGNFIPFPREVKSRSIIATATKCVDLDQGVKVIGERINPTGKKKLKEALINNNLDYILREAVNQKEKGADILDVNVGLPEINETLVITNVVREIQSIVDLPLQIDSSDTGAIEAALRIYNGKAIINSVNGKAEVMDSVFKIAKKYGACVVGLTLDENGIPSLAEERFKIAEKIVNTAEKYGIPKENLLIDCLVLTASAQQKEVSETLKAITMVREKLGVKTVLGVSNVSFGLPNRALLNRTFLTMALHSGLTTPILNPQSEEMMHIIKAFNVLTNHDKDSTEYINFFNDIKPEKKNIKTSDLELPDIIRLGLKEEGKIKVYSLLEEHAPMYIIDNYLIPVLDTIGMRFEKGEIFLPQLIQTAETVKYFFEILKDEMVKEKKEFVNRGDIILATVKGDIHDIGKNIVKIVLENYGYNIIDLGKDVPVEKVVSTAKEKNVRLIGLSALMTTTVKSMEETITSLRDNNIDCKIFVGGAVLTQEYADMIGADFYAEDAQESVRIADKFFNR